MAEMLVKGEFIVAEDEAERIVPCLLRCGTIGYFGMLAVVTG